MPRENLWDRPGVPHKGWRCVAVEDIGEAIHTCGMCGREEIRHVHTLEHPHYPNTLEVGCVCAEKMEEESFGRARGDGTSAPTPREREASLRGRDARRKKWPKRRWRPSRKGGFYLRTQGLVITITPAGPRWAAGGGRPDRLVPWTWAPGNYDSVEAAQLAIFDALWPARVRF